MSRTDNASLAIAAQPDAIYRAFSDPDVLMAWLPPENMTGRVLEYDFREGGRYRIELTYAEAAAGKTAERTDISSGRFLSLKPGKRIVQSVEFESADAAFAGQMVMTWSFDSLGESTRVTITAENVPPGIKESGTAAKDSWLSLLYFLAAMGSYCWPFVAAVHSSTASRLGCSARH
jgi:uncharacterized protein YndB with AHSA1/START domain